MSDLDKKYPLRLDTRINFKNLIPHFYISDNQTNDFYIKLTNDNKPVEVEDIIVVIAVINPNGNINSSFLDTKTEKGLIYCNLPNELKNVVGAYKARIMCISGEERIVSNTFEYKVDTDEFQLIDDITEDSEEMIVLSQMLSRLSNMEIESQANETERTANENERIANEAERIENENLRQQAENNRNTTEQARVVAESNRISNESERVLGEQTRVENEQNRISAENERISNENIRKENENRRLEKENNNIQAELNRVQAESNRVQAELKREQSENARKNSEDTRNSNEDVRKQNELKRQSNENTRITNESTRIANEAVRVSNEDKRHATALANEKRINDLYNDTVSKTNKLVQDVNLSINNIIDDTTARANELIEDTTTKTNKVIEDATTNVNELIEDINTSVESYAEAEAQRQANEDERIANENERAKVNADRQRAEQTRVTNERNRKEAETARASAERNRVNNESVRISNENVRKNNEEKRKEEFKAKMIEVDNALASLETPDMNTLTKDNTEEFIPTGDYNPATKKYVDDSVLNTVQIMGKDVVIYNDKYNVFKNPSIKDDILKYLTDYYCYEYDSPANDSYLNLNNHLRNILNKCSEVATANNDIVVITCSATNEGVTNFCFSIDEYDFRISIVSELGTVLINGTFSTGSCTREVKIFDEYATKEYVDSNIPCKTVNRNELFRITSDEINHSLGESKLIFTITNSNIINENKRYIVGFSYKERLGYLSDGVLNFNFETYTIDIYKSNDNTFKITINNFPTEFAGVEGEPTVTDLVLYEEEIQFINEKYLPNTVASKKYVDDNKFSGNYEDLNNEPFTFIPIKIIETNESNGFTTAYCDVFDLEQGYRYVADFTKYNNACLYTFNSDNTKNTLVTTTAYLGTARNGMITVRSSSTTTRTILWMSAYGSEEFKVTKNSDGTFNITNSVIVPRVGNVKEFTPTSDYNLVHKKYVDDSIATVNADTIDNLHIWTGTQAQYDALGTKDSNTIYLIKEG